MDNIFTKFGKIWDNFFGGGKGETTTSQTPQQKLQEAVQRDIELASAKNESASAAVVTAVVYRKELAKLSAQHEELGRQALAEEKAGRSAQAQKILALKLAIGERMKDMTEKYETANNNAQALITEARKQSKAVQEASSDLPRRVLQLELNSMMEKAHKMEETAKSQIDGKQGYKALAESIDMQSIKLMTKSLIKDNSPDLDEEVGQVLKDVAFQTEYKKLKEQAEISGGDVTDAEIINEDPGDKAKRLLSQEPFGGLLSAPKEPDKVLLEK
jgi:hypothetical protein